MQNEKLELTPSYCFGNSMAAGNVNIIRQLAISIRLGWRSKNCCINDTHHI
jgi:hypothetical protein